MSTILPQTLTSLPNTNFHGTYEYRYYQTVNNKHIYALWALPNNGWVSSNQNYSIRVNTATNTWEDNGAADPVNITLVGSNVELYGAADLLYKFTKPTTASWIPVSGSGGGTSSSTSSSTTSKKVFRNFW